jgi:hypothetical protein
MSHNIKPKRTETSFVISTEDKGWIFYYKAVWGTALPQLFQSKSPTSPHTHTHTHTHKKGRQVRSNFKSVLIILSDNKEVYQKEFAPQN